MKNVNANAKLVGAAIVPIRTSMRESEIKNILFMTFYFSAIKLNINMKVAFYADIYYTVEC